MNNEYVLRVVAKSGKYSLAYTSVDSDGDFNKIVESDVELSFRNMQELKDLIVKLNEASKMPVLHVGSYNKRIIDGN